jgi:hypothetical protein
MSPSGPGAPSPSPAPPPASRACPNPACGAANPGTNRYCGMCGAPLQPQLAALQQEVEWAVAREIQRALRDQVRDRKVLELETAEAISTRVWGWAKLFGTAVGVVLTIFVAVLGLLGYKSFSDVSKAGADAQAAIRDQQQQLQGQADRLQKDGEALSRRYQEHEKQLAEAGGQLPRLKEQIASVQGELGRAQTLLAQIPEIRGKLQDIEKRVGPSITLSNDFLHRVKDRATLEVKLAVDKVGAVHPARLDGDIHVAGRDKSLGLVLVAEIMNAKDEQPAVELLRKAEGADRPVAVAGVWRVWFEQAGGGAHVQGASPEPADSANPDHLFEIHPVTRVDTTETLQSVRPIEGYEPKDAARAFIRFEALPCTLIPEGKTTAIVSVAAGYNYVKFVLEAAAPPREVEDGWLVTAKVRDLEGELLVEQCRMVFVKGTPPANGVKDLRPGGRLRVLGMPRINLNDVAARVQNAGKDPDGLNAKLPYEVVVVGVYDKD